MSFLSQTHGIPHTETLEDSSFFLGAEFSFDAMYPPPILPDEDCWSVERLQPLQNGQPLRRFRPRASLACIQCRSRHMKCDAKPVRSRCRVDEIQCVYTKSRRGGKRRLGVKEVVQESTPNLYRSTGATSSPNTLSNTVYSVQASEPVSNVNMLLDNQLDAHVETLEPEKLLDLYYENFHDAHPIVLPRSQLKARLQSDPESLRDLIPVLECIGSVYKADKSSDNLRQAVYDALTNRPLPCNGFSVQALLLFALTVHCCDEYDAGDIILDQAINIALSIQMFRQPFAQVNGESDVILQESWRRTAWGLFNTDAVFAAIYHRSTHRLQTVIIDVELPCEDQEYEIGKIPRPRTLTEYDNREFDEDETIFSSFTYFIDVGRILSSTIAITQQVQDPSDLKLHIADAKIVTWFLYLPKCKQEIMRENREVDEVMFLAHLWINTEKLLLHRPYSQLQYNSIETSSKCTPNAQTRASEKSVILHTTKTLEAVEAVFELFALPSSYLKHSPIVTCSLALVVMAQVSACNHVFRQGGNSYMANRERVRMGLGVLKAHEKYWGMARRTANEVKGIARQLLALSQGVEAGGSSGSGSEQFAYSKSGNLSAVGQRLDMSGLLEGQGAGFRFGTLDTSAF